MRLLPVHLGCVRHRMTPPVRPGPPHAVCRLSWTLHTSGIEQHGTFTSGPSACFQGSGVWPRVLGLSNVPLCGCTTSCLSVPDEQAFRLFPPFGGCEGLRAGFHVHVCVQLSWTRPTSVVAGSGGASLLSCLRILQAVPAVGTPPYSLFFR